MGENRATFYPKSVSSQLDQILYAYVAKSC